MQEIRQTGLVITYIAKFKRYITQIVYKDISLRNQFYIRLKETIKDNIA